MGSVRMFRDRVVSMEQTQEIGEKHIDLLSALVAEALPGFAVASHGLEHERDHYWLALANEGTGAACRVVFTRMFLSDESRLPAVAADPKAEVREQIVACIRDQAGRAEILVTVARLLTEEERAEREEIESEWRKKHEVALAARRAEDERRAREKQRQKQQEDGRRRTQRDRERHERAAAGNAPVPQAQGEGARGGRRRRRGRGGNAPGQPPSGPRPQNPPRPPQVAIAQPVAVSAGPAPEGPRAEGGGSRRRRRRGRGRGGPGGSKPGSPPSSSSGGSNES